MDKIILSIIPTLYKAESFVVVKELNLSYFPFSISRIISHSIFSYVGKKIALLVFQRFPVCRQKPNVLFVRSAFSAWHTTFRGLASVAEIEAKSFNLATR